MIDWWVLPLVVSLLFSCSLLFIILCADDDLPMRGVMLSILTLYTAVGCAVVWTLSYAAIKFFT